MAKKHTDGLTDKERKDLESVGYIEGNPATIPDNVNPALKAKVLEAYAQSNDIEAAQDLPDATSRQNQAVRERAAADGDKDMQKVTGVEEGAKTGERQGKATN